MANSKKTETPKKCGSRCCSSKKQSGVQAKSNTNNKSTSRTQSKKSEITK